MNLEQGLQKMKLKSAYTEADKIIAYLLNPNDESIVLTEKEKKKFDIIKSIYGYRMRYQRKADIVILIQHEHKVKERQAYKLINECEEVFGSVDGVHKAFERNFLLEVSRKNIEIAMVGKNSDSITKALLAHYKLCGLDEVIIDMPDFSALEPNTYIISLPKGQDNLISDLLGKGSVNLEELIPHQNVKFIDVNHEDVTDEQSGSE